MCFYVYSFIYVFWKWFLVYSKIDQKRDASHILCPHNPASPSINISHYRGIFVDSWWTCLDMSASPRAHSLHSGSLWVLCVLWPWTNIYWHVSLTLGSACSFLLCFSIPSLPLATTELVTLSIVLWIPDCHRVGSIRHIAFSDWLFFT